MVAHKPNPLENMTTRLHSVQLETGSAAAHQIFTRIVVTCSRLNVSGIGEITYP